MSTKTLRKRIALVAVSAMGFGLLTSVAANAGHSAGSFTAANINTDVTSTVVASFSSYCSDTSVVGTADSITIPVGVTFTTTVGIGAVGSTTLSTALKAGVITGGSIAYKSLSGGTKDTTGTGAIDASNYISSGGRLALSGPTQGSAADDNGDAAAAVFTFQSIAPGSASIVYAAGTDADVASTASNTLYITVVSACTSATYSASKSFVKVTGAGDSGNAGDNVDSASSAAAGDSLYVYVTLKNAYDAAITTGTLSASATNGALVSWSHTTTSAGSKGTTSASTITPDGTEQLRVNPASAAAGGSTVVTISHNGTVVATKTLTFFGEAASIEIGTVKSGKVSTTNGAATATGYFLYTYKDAAGNVVPGAAATLDTTTQSATVPTITSEKAPTITASAATGGLIDTLDTATGVIGNTTSGVFNFDCGATPGTASVTIKHTNAISEAVITKSVTLSCAGGIDTYTVATDKASYRVGEIATITITAKDSKGNPVADSTAMALDTVSVGGGALTKAVATSDLFSAGVRTYKAQMTDAGTFNVVVSLAGDTTTSATASYSVTDGAVSNTEVLAAIVKLIASINKQITSLQKLLTKKK